MAIAIKVPGFSPHPQGVHTGVITNVRDEGLRETQWGDRRKVSVRVDSETAMMENGRPFVIIQWYTLSSAAKAPLRLLREDVLGRPTTPEERASLDPDELVGKRISFHVDHVTRRDGTVRPIIRDGSVRPMKNTSSVADSGAEDDQPF